MKDRILKTCIALLMLASLPAYAASFLNGDFETGSLDPWYQDREIDGGFEGSSSDWSISTDAHTGTYSATNTNNLELRQDFDSILTSDITSLSFWAKHDAHPALAFTAFYSDATHGEDVVFTDGTDWTFFDVTSFLLGGKSLVAISIFGVNGGSTWLDDVVLNYAGSPPAVPVPAALFMFAPALLGFMGLRRKAKNSAV